MYFEMGLSHIGCMTNDHENKIALLRKARGFTQQELADELGVHVITVSKIERGKMQLTTKWIRRLAAALDADPTEIFAPAKTSQVISLHGSIRRGFISGYREEGDKYAAPLDDPDEAASIWLAVADDTLHPYFHWGDALRFTTYFDDMFEHSLGRLVFITTSDDSRLLGTVEKYQGNGIFDLRLMSGKIFEGIEVETFRMFTAAMIRALDESTLGLMDNLSRSGLKKD